MPEGNLGKQITFLSLKMYLLLLYAVYLLGGHTCHSTFVETRGQLCGVHSVFIFTRVWELNTSPWIRTPSAFTHFTVSLAPCLTSKTFFCMLNM